MSAERRTADQHPAEPGGMAAPGQPADAVADRLLGALGDRRSIPPLSDADAGFDLSRAYRVAAAVTARRMARGETPVGWKIGFTNRTIWDEYGVFAPIWGPMYDSTVREAGEGPVVCALDPFVEPRIEPEIAFRMARAPTAGMDEAELMGCVDAVCHGFEIVQSLFPGWRFQAADTAAAFALHGAYFHGPWESVEEAGRARWRDMLATFEIVLFRNGEEVDLGQARNVLGGPLSALGHFVEALAAHPFLGSVRPGEMVTTGTVTRAFPVVPGEQWSTRVDGLPLPGLEIAFR